MKIFLLQVTLAAKQKAGANGWNGNKPYGWVFGNREIHLLRGKKCNFASFLYVLLLWLCRPSDPTWGLSSTRCTRIRCWWWLPTRSAALASSSPSLNTRLPWRLIPRWVLTSQRSQRVAVWTVYRTVLVEEGSRSRLWMTNNTAMKQADGRWKRGTHFGQDLSMQRQSRIRSLDWLKPV